MIFDKIAFLYLKATSLPGTLMGGFFLFRHARITTVDHKSDGRWLPKEKNYRLMMTYKVVLEIKFELKEQKCCQRSNECIYKIHDIILQKSLSFKSGAEQ